MGQLAGEIDDQFYQFYGAAFSQFSFAKIKQTQTVSTEKLQRTLSYKTPGVNIPIIL